MQQFSLCIYKQYILCHLNIDTCQKRVSVTLGTLIRANGIETTRKLQYTIAMAILCVCHHLISMNITGILEDGTARHRRVFNTETITICSKCN